MPTISTLTVEVEAKTSKLSSGLKIASGGLLALGAGAAYAFGQFEDSQKVMNQTNAVLKSTGDASGKTAQHIEALSGKLSQLSGIDDETIQSGENMLLTFKNIQGARFDQATKAMVDMSAAMAAASGGSVDLKSASIQLGKALNDPVKGVTALTRVGVTFSQQQKDQIQGFIDAGQMAKAQGVILKEVNSEFAGSAEANATAAGKMSVALGNLAERAGQVLAPAIEFGLAALTGFVAVLQADVGPALAKAGEWFKSVWVKVGPFVTIIGQAAVDAFHKIVAAAAPLWPQLKKLWAAMQPVAKTLGILIGVLLLVALKVLPIVFAALAKLISITLAVDTALFRFANTVGHVFLGLVDFFRHLPSRLAAAGSKMWDWIVSSLKAAVNAVIGLLNGLISHINAFQIHVHIDPPGPGNINFDWGGLGIPPIPSLQYGGIVARTGLALVHEGERFSGVQSAGWGDVTVNVAGSVVTERDLVDAIHRGLLKKQRRTGTLGIV